MSDRLVESLRAAGCVYAEEEAAILREAGGDELEAMVRARVAGAPLEQLVGWVEFAGRRLSVGPGVFVPRRRTEFLARVAVESLRAVGAAEGSGDETWFVEAFCGVAPVAAAVRASLPHVRVHTTDVDERALGYARANVPGAGVSAGEVLAGLPADLRGRVSVIAAVPPYVPTGARGLLPREAREFEPARALFGGADGLAPSAELIAQAPAWLAPGGRLLLELNSEQYDDARALAIANGFAAARRDSGDGQTIVLELARAREAGA